MKKLKLYMCGVALLASAVTFAQKKSEVQGTTLGIGVEAGLPLSKAFKQTQSVGIGGSAKVGIPIFEGGDVTISAGYISFSGKTESGYKYPALNTIPLKAGLRYSISGDFYGEPQLGYTILSAKDPTTGKSESDGAFTYAAGVGYMVNKKIDIGLRYEAFTQSEDVGNGVKVSLTSSLLGLRVAYNFGL